MSEWVGSKDFIREDIFPTSIYRRRCDLDVGRLLRVVSGEREEDQGIERSNVRACGAWHSSRTDFHNHSAFAELNQQIIRMCWGIAEDRQWSRDHVFEIVSMWANEQTRGGFNRVHTHPNSLLSGVFYLKCDPGSGRIGFSDPRPGALAVTPVAANPQDLSYELRCLETLEVSANMLLMFPSWLPHEVEPFQGEDGFRVSLAFNVIQSVRY